jgi:hypothetical protein
LFSGDGSNLTGISGGSGEANVQVDWNETTTTDDAYILNKPVDATASVTGLATATQITKLDGIEASANNYSHPSDEHLPSSVSQAEAGYLDGVTSAIQTQLNSKAASSHGTHLTTNSVGITELNVSDGTNGQVLSTNGSGTLSFATASGGANITSAATAPASPSVGDQWFNTTTGVLSTYMTDGTDSDWLDVSSANGLAASPGGGGGAMEFVSKTTISSGSSSVSFTGLSSGFTYKLFFIGLDRSASAYVYARFLDGNDAEITASEYGTKLVNNGSVSYTGNQQSSAVLAYSSGDITNGDIKIQLTAGGSIGSLIVESIRLHQATSGWSTEESSSSAYLAASTAPTGGISGLKLYPSSGTFDAGIMTLYKIKDS